MGRKKKNSSSKTKDECKKIVVKSEVYHISEDLIREILLRLPPNYVLRFKQVCKTWYSLITNPDFLRTHFSSLQFYKHTTLELMVSSYFSKIIPLRQHPLYYPNELLDCYVINSCNGLLLLRKKSISSSYYYVCNPMIKHYVKIPNITINEKFNVFDSTTPYILFDPSTSLSYKLIWCLKGIGEHMCDFHVFSSDIGSWRFLRRFPCSEIGSLWRQQLNTAVFLNGIFYWKTLYTGGDHLVCFDLKEKNVWFLPLPPKPMGNSTRMCFYFGECDGRLRLIEKYFVSQRRRRSHLTIPCSFDIMETEPQQQQQQKDGHPTWSVKYHVHINLGYVENHPASTFRIIQLYETKKNEEALLLNINGMIVPFNLKNNTFGKKLRIDQKTFIFNDLSDFTNVFPYIKTTLLPLL